MAGSSVRKAGSYLGRRTALRFLPWAWPLYAGVGFYRAVEHELTQRERTKLKRMARKSLGIPTRLTRSERDELRRMLAKLNPLTVGRFVAAEASPLPWPKPPKRTARK